MVDPKDKQFKFMNDNTENSTEYAWQCGVLICTRDLCLNSCNFTFCIK